MSISTTEAGRRGAAARAQSMTPEQRKASAQHAARARWAKVREQVRESRKAQGLSPTVDDARLLEELAREVGGTDG
jgi:hypothetical protein